jgi:MinD superfamily P-loop ATPase
MGIKEVLLGGWEIRSKVFSLGGTVCVKCGKCSESLISQNALVDGSPVYSTPIICSECRAKKRAER